MNHRSLLACLLGLTVGVLMSDAFAQTRPPTDAALGALIEELSDRHSDGLLPEILPDGSKVIDLKGRFQQVPLGQFIGDGQAMVACVNSVAEANTFFGRNLLSGTPLSSAASDAHAALVAEARRHGMNVTEYQFYGDLIEQGLAAPEPLGATVTIVNNDGAGEGFNSTAAQILPAPGNDANANLGAQRLALFNAAAQIWGDFLDSSVAIQIRSQFDPLAPCTPSGGVLGSAGALTLVSDFVNAEFTNTLYHVALANKVAGTDHSDNPDINATFNSSVDTGCLGAGTHFYYGLDNATPAGTVNLFVVLLHEIGHGMGSSSFTNGQTGEFAFGIPDIWARYLFDSTAGLTWFEMNNAQRAASATNTNNLFWDGANVRNASEFLSAGRDTTTGRVQMYAPNPFQGGSSVSHYSNAAFPNLLMEPSINSGLPLTLDLTRQQMRDIGWYSDSGNDLVPDAITSVLPSGGSLRIGSSQNITWTNTGGFDHNVTIELSLDGGSTFPVAVASNVANSGSHAWTVPDNPTNQGRLRVREHDYLSPSGQSTAIFSISSDNTAPTFTPAGAIAREQGSAPGAAVTVGTVNDAETEAGSLIVTQITGGTASGISVGDINNTAGTVTATLAASCSATAGTVRFQVSDGDLDGTGDLLLNVTLNTPPTLGAYANTTVAVGQGAVVSPGAAPSDNGSVDSIDATILPVTFAGTLDADLDTGKISIGAASPSDAYIVSVTITDNCGATAERDFTLEVDGDRIFSDGFESIE